MFKNHLFQNIILDSTKSLDDSDDGGGDEDD